MDIFRHMEIFTAVVEHGTMRKAADMLYISQPSVSQAIRELEEEYNVVLFERLSKKLYITEAGKVFYSYARQLLETMNNLNEAMNMQDCAPILRVGASVTVGISYIRSFTEWLEDQINNIDIRVMIDNTSNIEKMLLTSELDLAIVEGSILAPELLQYPLCSDRLVMVVGREHPFYRKKDLYLEQLHGQSLLSRESGSADRNQMEIVLSKRNIVMKKKWCSTNTEAIKQAAIAGEGIAILSKRLIEKELDSEDLWVLPINEGGLNRSFKLMIHKDKILPEAIKTAVSIWQEKSQQTDHGEGSN